MIEQIKNREEEMKEEEEEIRDFKQVKRIIR